MRFQSSDPDIETLVRRIQRDLIDLQPDFQRGEVWPTIKKQRLIDSVLRGWHIPPIHLVKKADGKSDVLDGQQRLTAIRDFVAGSFGINGAVEPLSDELKDLHGKRWNQLPDEVKERLNVFTIRVFELTDYAPQEPYELFFRLNQPTNLTEAEKRNAFVGGPRNQIKELSGWAIRMGMASDTVGFSNARMAYDDVLSRFLITLEDSSVLTKVTSARITERYRTGEEFSSGTMQLCRSAIEFVMTQLQSNVGDKTVRPNRATLFTWLCFAAGALSDWSNRGDGTQLFQLDFSHSSMQQNDLFLQVVHGSIEMMERARTDRHSRLDRNDTFRKVVEVFDDRATSRVGDVSSVVLRDYCAWLLVAEQLGIANLPDNRREACDLGLKFLRSDRIDDVDSELLRIATGVQWGAKGWL